MTNEPTTQPPTLTGDGDTEVIAAYIGVSADLAEQIVANMPKYRPLLVPDTVLFPAWSAVILPEPQLVKNVEREQSEEAAAEMRKGLESVLLPLLKGVNALLLRYLLRRDRRRADREHR